ITVTENLLPAVNLGVDTLLCRNTSIILEPGNFQSYQWQDGTNDSIFIPVYSGVHTVIISVLVSDSANCFASDTVAIFYDVCNEVVFITGSSSYVWPVPADDIFYLQFSDKRGEIMVFNSLGEIFYKDRLFNSASINCKSWPSGSYFYKIVKEDGLNISGKIFIRHP
ncbi:MAG: T9SS type A sorting domain-containing protein, partial [Bacteroidia bacterium]|nr:T9SS type A sorting domain-containing protein [Bacteroidia bacterium]